MPKKVDEKTALSWLAKTHPDIKIVDWGGKSSNISTFIQQGRVFQYRFSSLKHKLKKNPNHEFGLSEEAIQKKRESTFMKKYGEKTNLTAQKEEIKNTLLRKYGVDHSFKIPEVIDKISSQKEKPINGKSRKEISEMLGLAYSTVCGQADEISEIDFSNLPEDFSFFRRCSNIERALERVLTEKKLKFVRSRKIFDNVDIRPDFFLEDFNLAIECDGLYWHSEAIDRCSNKNFHFNRAKEIEKNGFRLLAFRSNEIIEKPDIVKSMIYNACGLSEKIGARKLSLIKNEKSTKYSKFFEDNHLMGPGIGRFYGLEDKNKEILFGCLFKARNKKKGEWEISRLCTKSGYSVQGGLSRVLYHFSKDYSPNRIVSFLDKRYGKGESLKVLRFKKKTSNPSFMWTDFKSCFHRMRYPGNSGYNHNLVKIWDYGQERWELEQ